MKAGSRFGQTTDFECESEAQRNHQSNTAISAMIRKSYDQDVFGVFLVFLRAGGRAALAWVDTVWDGFLSVFWVAGGRSSFSWGFTST